MDAEALVRALGELAVSLRRRRGGKGNSDSNAEKQKRAVLRWLRGLRGEELASLCCVEDVGFVKTLLHMAARCKGASSGVHEFQLLPQAVGGAQSKRAAKMPPRSAPREFVKRPVARTVDGDVVGCFWSREYEQSSRDVLRAMRVLNTLQSCDTVALSMEFFQPEGSRKGAKFAEVFRVMEVISRGGFLLECPSDSTLKHRVWGETKWLKEQGFYSLQALFVNQIELNIWSAWKQHKKDDSTKIHLRGLASKLHLVREWEAASDSQRTAALEVLGNKTISHLRDLNQSALTKGIAPANFLAARSSLEALMDVLAVFQRSVRQAGGKIGRENQGHG
ncbi:DNA polymerase sigma [Phytophthora cinnamomi]|uniref:DNA polymerase sigma n=1 Tax=Phytophthora cinnamomi TaxID=4785 RepID=UPI0035595E34|nr:DNA polymerase sigma [Phytophthora cinnamomi]